MKLQTKITLLFSMAISLVFSLAVLLIGVNVVQYNRNITTKLNTQLIEAKAAEAGSWLTQRISELRIISRADAVMTMDEELQEFINRLNDECSFDYGNDYGTFAVGGLDGLGYVTVEQTIDISERDYFIEAMSGEQEYVLSQPVYSKTDDSRIILICYPVYNRFDERIGFVNGAVSLNRLTELTEGIQFYDGISLIVDSQGAVYTNVPEQISEELLTAVIQEMPQDDSLETAIYSLKWNEADLMLFYVPVPDTDDWYLCTIVNRQSVMNDSQLLLVSIVVIWVLLLVISFILSYYISRTVTRSVKRLSEGMGELQTGDFGIVIKPEGNDEVAFLTECFNQMVLNIRELINQNTQEQKEKYLLKLQMFQAQIKPHFLYNTLDTLHWQALEYDAEEMADMIGALSTFFRSTLSKGEEFITIKEELVHISSYLKIQGYRYADIFEYEIECSPTVERYYIARLLIQPLIENSIYHGIKPQLTRGKLKVEIIEQETHLNIIVADDGKGMNVAQLEQVLLKMRTGSQENSYGLYNVNQRIQLIYGKKYGLQIESKSGKGTRVVLYLPKIETENVYEPDINL